MTILKRTYSLISVLCFLLTYNAKAQMQDSLASPKVRVDIKLLKNPIKVNEDICLTITLLNDSESTQSVWVDKPRPKTVPAQTTISLIDTKTGKSVLAQPAKAVFESTIYSADQIRRLSYQLKPGQKVSREFNLLDVAVLKDNSGKLKKGDYELMVFYCENLSNSVTFTVL